MRLLSFWLTHRAELASMLQRHIFLVGVSTLVAIAIGVPAGIVAARHRRVGRPVLLIANVAQTIPSLALLGFLLPLPVIGGIGPRIAIVALVLYGLLPIVRGTAAGLTSIDRGVIQAAEAMGMTGWQRLWLVELPLALPSIVGGIRVATIVGIGTATIAAAIGAGGLGEYIFRGLSMVDSTVILAGAVPAALLALSADALLTMIERFLAVGRRPRHRVVVAAAAALLAIVAAPLAFGGRSDTPRAVVVGSKNFTEQILLGELLAQSLERHGVPVVRRFNLGGTFICDRAIRSGDIDAYVEYSGTALTAIFKAPILHDRDAVLNAIRTSYAAAGLTVLSPLGFNNTFAILVRHADAQTLGLHTIGDLRAWQDRWTPGFGYEFVERADGYRGLAAAYDLHFSHEPRVMDLTLMYRALAERQVDVVAGDATSGLITALDLTMLGDDRAYFPPYHAVPIVRTAVVLGRPEVRAAIEALAGQVTDAGMRSMNYSVDVQHQDVGATVRSFLAGLR